MNNEQSPMFDLGESDNLPAQRLRDMHGVYGNKEGRTCGECSHLCAKVRSRTYYKCCLSKVTAGAMTDWRKSWSACGKFEDKNV